MFWFLFCSKYRVSPQSKNRSKVTKRKSQNTQNCVLSDWGDLIWGYTRGSQEIANKRRGGSINAVLASSWKACLIGVTIKAKLRPSKKTTHQHADNGKWLQMTPYLCYTWIARGMGQYMGCCSCDFLKVFTQPKMQWRVWIFGFTAGDEVRTLSGGNVKKNSDWFFPSKWLTGFEPGRIFFGFLCDFVSENQKLSSLDCFQNLVLHKKSVPKTDDHLDPPR